MGLCDPAPPPSSGRSKTVPGSLQVSPHMASLDGSLPRRGLEDTRVCEDGPQLCRWGRDVGGSSPRALQGRAPRAAPAGSLLCPQGSGQPPCSRPQPGGPAPRGRDGLVPEHPQLCCHGGRNEHKPGVNSGCLIHVCPAFIRAELCRSIFHLPRPPQPDGNNSSESSFS